MDWTGTENYSKVENYQILANDFVLATLPAAEAKRLIEAKSTGTVQVATAPSGKDYRAALEAAGRTIPLVEMTTEDDASFLGDDDRDGPRLELEPPGTGKSASSPTPATSPVTVGPYPGPERARRELRTDRSWCRPT